jgi:hypothetical protein
VTITRGDPDWPDNAPTWATTAEISAHPFPTATVHWDGADPTGCGVVVSTITDAHGTTTPVIIAPGISEVFTVADARRLAAAFAAAADTLADALNPGSVITSATYEPLGLSGRIVTDDTGRHRLTLTANYDAETTAADLYKLADRLADHRELVEWVDSLARVLADATGWHDPERVDEAS